MINKLKLLILFSILLAFGLTACVAGNNVGSSTSGVSLNTAINTVSNVEPVNPNIKPGTTYSCTVNPGETKFCGHGNSSIDTVTGLGFVPPVYIESQSLPLAVKVAGEAPDYRLTSTSKEMGLSSTKIVYKTLHKSYTRTQLVQAMKRIYVRSVGQNSSLKGANEFFPAYVESIPSGYGLTTDQSNYMASPSTKYGVYITNKGDKSITVRFKPLAEDKFVGKVRVINSTNNPLSIEGIPLGNNAQTLGDNYIAANSANIIAITAKFSTRFSYKIFDDKTKEVLCDGTVYRPSAWLYKDPVDTIFTLYVTSDGKCNTIERDDQEFFQNEYNNFIIAENKSINQSVKPKKITNVALSGLYGSKIYNMVVASFSLPVYEKQVACDILRDGRVLCGDSSEDHFFTGWNKTWNNKIVGAAYRFDSGDKKELNIFLNDGTYVYLFPSQISGYSVQGQLPLDRLCSLQCNLSQYKDKIISVSNAANNRNDLIFFLKDNTFVYWDMKRNQLSAPAPLEEIFGSEINKYLGQIVSIRISYLSNYGYTIMLSSGDNLIVKMNYPNKYSDRISIGLSTKLASYIPSIRSGFWDYKKNKMVFLMHGSGATPNSPWVIYGDQSDNWDWLPTYFSVSDNLLYPHLYDVIQNGWGSVYLKKGLHQDSDAFLLLRGKDVTWVKIYGGEFYSVDTSFKLVFGAVADANYESTRWGGVTNYYDSQDNFILFQKNNTYFLSKYKDENYSRGPYPLSFLNPLIDVWEGNNTTSVYRGDLNRIVFMPRDGSSDSRYSEYDKPTVSIHFNQVEDDIKQQYIYLEFTGFIINTPRYSYLFNRNNQTFITYDQFYSNGGLSANSRSTSLKGSLWEALSKDRYGSWKAATTFDNLVIGSAYIKTSQGMRIRVFLKSDSKSQDTQYPSYLDLDPTNNNQITDWKFIDTTYPSAKQIMPFFDSKLVFVYNIYGGKYTDFVLNDMQVVRFDNVSGTSEVKKLSELYDGVSSPFLAQQLWINSADPFDDNM